MMTKPFDLASGEGRLFSQHVSETSAGRTQLMVPHLCRTRNNTYLAGALVVAALVAACSEQSTTTVRSVAPDHARLIASLTPEAARSLDASGGFRLGTQTPNPAYPELTSQQTERLAALWPAQFGSMVRKNLEEGHGGPINFRSLNVCGRTLYAQSAFEPPPLDIPAPRRKPYGPWWFVTLCESQRPTLSLAISAWATELTIVKDKILFPRVAGNEFFPLGIPAGHMGEFPLSPEEAVTIAANHVGRRVAAIPQLVMAAKTDGPPQAARWRLPLEMNGLVHGLRSGDVAVSELFVGSPDVRRDSYAVFIAAKDQPPTFDFPWIPLPEQGEARAQYNRRIASETHFAKVRRLAGTPTKFELTNNPPEDQ
jgi:hypothetical protein